LSGFDAIIGNESALNQHWHSAGSLHWPFPMIKYKYIFKIKYTEALLSNSTWKLLWFEITKMLIAIFFKYFIIMFGTLSFCMHCNTR